MKDGILLDLATLIVVILTIWFVASWAEIGLSSPEYTTYSEYNLINILFGDSVDN